jgi:hypothetical protein
MESSISMVEEMYKAYDIDHNIDFYKQGIIKDDRTLFKLLAKNVFKRDDRRKQFKVKTTDIYKKGARW